MAMNTIKKILPRPPNHSQSQASNMTAALAGKVALITGASKGIGAATALEIASLGAKVVINYSSDPEPAEELVSKIGVDQAIAIRANVADVAEIERLVQETVAWGGQIDILIPNAGMSIMKTLEQTKEADFQKTMDLNVKGPYFLAQVRMPPPVILNIPLNHCRKLCPTCHQGPI